MISIRMTSCWMGVAVTVGVCEGVGLSVAVGIGVAVASPADGVSVAAVTGVGVSVEPGAGVEPPPRTIRGVAGGVPSGGSVAVTVGLAVIPALWSSSSGNPNFTNRKARIG